MNAETAMEELALLEKEEIENIVERLSKRPDFVAFIARWVLDAGDPPSVAIRPEGLYQANYQIGRASLLSEFMESLKKVHNAAYLNVMEEVNRYGRRRQRVDERVELSSDD